jgi:hypothetical protein
MAQTGIRKRRQKNRQAELHLAVGSTLRTMRIKWTRDIAVEDLRELSTELGSDFGVAIEEMPRIYKGGVPPSWIRLYADADWWIKGLGAYAALYVAEIVKEAAKDTWRNRGKIAAAAVSTGGRVRQLAVALAKLRHRFRPETSIEIGLPFPDDYDGTLLEITGDDADELAAQCAVFVHYLPALLKLIREEGLGRATIATGIQLAVRPDLSLEVSWQDGSLARQVRVLTLTE